MKLSLILLALALHAQPYRAERVEPDLIRLTEAAHAVEVSIVPSVGNRAIEMKVGGRNILHFPYAGAAEFRARPRLSGIPFLAPWADLLDQPAFWANGKRYLLVNAPQWRVTDVSADARGARVTSRLEFWRYPELAAQWSFAHEYEMTYSLADGALEVRTAVTNLSDEPMPIVLGYHPYFQIPEVPRDEWVIRSPARIHVIPGEHNIPTGEMRPIDLPNPISLRGRTLDEGFTDLERDAAGRAHFSIEAGVRRIEVTLGAKYTVATI